MNPETLPQTHSTEKVVTFPHFLPRIDLIPFFVSRAMRHLDPILGSTGIGRQSRMLGSGPHIYGHSRIDRRVRFDGVTCINNAPGNHQESAIAARRLIEIVDDA